ncbi:MAG: hypothetical protein V3R81_11660 [Gammaproteobacteria bacterium]
MEQRSFEFSNDESHPFYLQLEKVQQQPLIELMAALIITSFQAQEKTQHDQSHHSVKN